MKEALFIDQDQEIVDMVDELKASIEHFNVRIVRGLKEAEAVLESGRADGVMVDGMYPARELTSFIKKARNARPAMRIVVLSVEVDMMLDEDFKKALDELKARVIPKTEAFRHARVKELLAWCCGADSGEAA